MAQKAAVREPFPALKGISLGLGFDEAIAGRRPGASQWSDATDWSCHGRVPYVACGAGFRLAVPIGRGPRGRSVARAVWAAAGAGGGRGRPTPGRGGGGGGGGGVRPGGP